jgi:DNA-binding response OmpR family regulator
MPPEHILLIDDDAELCDELSEMLRSEGYKVTCASDSYEGEAMIRCLKFDTLILDCKMPLASGIEILERMKGENIKKKVIFISGRPFVENELKDRGLSGGVKAVLGKPIDFDLLLQKVRS